MHNFNAIRVYSMFRTKALLAMAKNPAPQRAETKSSPNTNKWVYFNLNFVPRDNPDKEINAANEHQRELKNFKSKSDHSEKIDYLAFNPGLNTGMAELWGARTYQEDKTVADQLIDFEKVPEDKREAVLKNYASNLQALIKQKQISGGSTLNTTIICGNKIYNAHAGDTDSYLAVIHADGEVSLTRLNKIHHHPKREKNRLKKLGVWQFVQKNRLHNPETRRSYANSRGMGDIDLEAYGFSSEVDTTTTECQLQPGERAFVITHCDGLKKLKEAQLKQIIKDHRHESPHNIAKALVAAADKTSSKDNKTSMITEINPKAPAQYQAVFDGHTNSNVSNFLYENSTDVLNAAIQNHLDWAPSLAI